MKMYQFLSHKMKHIRLLEKNIEKFPNRKEEDSAILRTTLKNVEDLIKDNFPHGFGFDSGTKFDFEKSTSEKLIFQADFHHMDDNGYYDGWTEHNVIVTPSFCFDFDIRITGRNKRDVKEYIAQCFEYSLTKEVPSPFKGGLK